MFSRKSKGILNVICNLGIFGFMFCLVVCIHMFILWYSTTRSMCYDFYREHPFGNSVLFLRDLDFKERIPEILIIVVVNVLSLFIIKQNVTLVAMIIAIATAACVLINRKKIGKIENSTCEKISD